MTRNQIRVLHVDDAPNFSDLIADRLENTADQITVQTVSTPNEGVSTLATDSVDSVPRKA